MLQIILYSELQYQGINIKEFRGENSLVTSGLQSDDCVLHLDTSSHQDHVNGGSFSTSFMCQGDIA